MSTDPLYEAGLDDYAVQAMLTMMDLMEKGKVGCQVDGKNITLEQAQQLLFDQPRWFATHAHFYVRANLS